MTSTGSYSMEDLCDIADAALGFNLHEQTVTMVDAIYDLLDGKFVEDLSDVVEVIRLAALTQQEAAEPLRRRQKHLLRIIFSLFLPFGTFLHQPRYVASAAGAGVALIGAAQSTVAEVAQGRLIQLSPSLSSIGYRHEDRGRQQHRAPAHNHNGLFYPVPMPSNYVRIKASFSTGTSESGTRDTLVLLNKSI